MIQQTTLTSLLDRPITAASDDGVCRWHHIAPWLTRYQAVADTREIIEIKSDLHQKLHNK